VPAATFIAIGWLAPLTVALPTAEQSLPTLHEIPDSEPPDAPEGRPLSSLAPVQTPLDMVAAIGWVPELASCPTAMQVLAALQLTDASADEVALDGGVIVVAAAQAPPVAVSAIGSVLLAAL
jgi:hypothetical protein